MTNNIIIRAAVESDRSFIFQLSPRLAEVAELKWHSDEKIQKMQDDYISEMLIQTPVPHTTLIAEKDSVPLGFIHARSHIDSISGQTCGTVPLLAVFPEKQGLGIGKTLVDSVEVWAKGLGYRLLHLEVFAQNKGAYNFYQKQGFEAETLHMIKQL
ncbi:MAG: GNAT superfamily N-acetyltransferase [Colwellia sp.]|jgi:GNAT superfamily N-acetyltransferase